jgi:hypothetical protein
VRQSFATRLRESMRDRPVLIGQKTRLPGDTPGLVRALHALSAAGLLEPNCVARGERMAPCPRCGRPTAVWRDVPPGVCTGCRAEYHRDRKREMGK